MGKTEKVVYEYYSGINGNLIQRNYEWHYTTEDVVGLTVIFLFVAFILYLGYRTFLRVFEG